MVRFCSRGSTRKQWPYQTLGGLACCPSLEVTFLGFPRAALPTVPPHLPVLQQNITYGRPWQESGHHLWLQEEGSKRDAVLKSRRKGLANGGTLSTSGEGLAAAATSLAALPRDINRMGFSKACSRTRSIFEARSCPGSYRLYSQTKF